MYRAIIVEDDPMVAAINRQYMEKNKEICIVGEFRNGKDALGFLEKEKADLAIVDYYMPVMDGLEFLRKCRKEDTSIGIIMITAANSAQDISNFLKLGIVDYLVKPFTYERFQQAMDKYLFMREAMRAERTLDQSEIDRIMASGETARESVPLEKGLQEQTLKMIRQYLREQKDHYMSSNEIAKHVELSRITVRRYMNFLLENDEITSRIDYSTGGRPSIRYTIKN